jgi:hypothetical protein
MWFVLCTPSKRCGMWIHYSCGVMTLPRSGRLNGDEQPQGLPDARVPRLFKVTVFIPAVDIELLLVAALTTQGLFCPSHRGDRIPSRPEGFAVAMALATPQLPRHGNRRSPLGESTTSATTSVPGLPDFPHTKSEGQALRVSLVKSGAYLSTS